MLFAFAGQALAQPAIDADLGVLPMNTVTTRTLSTPGAQVRWYRFELAQPVQLADMTFLNIDTLGSVVLDTEVALYEATGNLIATDDDDAAGSRSALTFGSGDNTFAGAIADFTNINNGRDGKLAAGVYYVAVSQFNATFSTTGWIVSVNPIGTSSSNLTVNLRLGTAPVFTSPPGTIDLGTLQSNQAINNTAGSLNASRPVQWYKVTLPDAYNALNSFVDIDTEGTTLSPTNATRLVMYTAAGAFTGQSDLTDGTNNLSQLTFGLTTPVRPAPSNGLNYNGRDGSLQGGTYFIGVAATGNTPSQTNITGQSLQFTSGAANFGALRLRIAGGAPSIPPVATPTTLITTEGTTGLLRLTVQPGLNPTVPITSVSVDATDIGGAANVLLNDTGTDGDEIAGDGIYSRSVQLNAAWLPNNVIDLPFIVTDELGRTATGDHAVIATPSITGGCCASGSCSVTREYLCTTGGGSFAGINTDCGGGVTYTVSPGSPFTPIANIGTPITFFQTLTGTTPTSDDGVARITLPFPVNFYGETYNEVRAVTNGFVQFTSDLTNWNNVNLPNNALPNNAIYAMWDDLLLTAAGRAYTFTQGTAPNRTFIISWENVGQYDPQPSGTFSTGSNDFQIVFRENSDNFELRYGALDAINNAIPQEDFVTIGCENQDGSKAVAVNTVALVGDGNTSLLFSIATTTNPCGATCDDIDFNNN
ncbi:MAG TPA: hypothetical protein VK157_13375, partial [Phycisphaerales bacterium]|nr:hypothetical protein [Phycisphaerales bacterium]